MFKVMVFLRRRPGLSRAELCRHYESEHAPLTERLTLEGRIPRSLDYRRNYFLLDDSATTLTDEEMPFDMLVEATFESREHYMLTKDAHGGDAELTAMVRRDLERYVDLASIKYLVVDERLTKL